MVDRYTKAVLTVIALCLVVLTVSTLLPTAQAQSTPQPQSAAQRPATAAQRRCVWTGVSSANKDAKFERDGSYSGKVVESLSEGGWELKGLEIHQAQGNTQNTWYIFERCDQK